MFILLLGVSGSGKTTVMTTLLQQLPHLQLVRSCVTRSMRPGEINGDRYDFVTQATFENMIEQHAFIEYAHVHGGAYYGTPRTSVQSVIDSGLIPIKEIDILGLELINNDPTYGPQAVSIFLDIDDQTMIQRITSRAPMSDDELQRRLKSAQTERSRAQMLCTHIIDAERPVTEVVTDILTCISSTIT